MSYTIRIERDQPITLAEWFDLVRTRGDLRLREDDHSVRNPQTGDVITIGRAEGETELSVGDAWVPCFRWRKSGTIAFEAPEDFDESESAVRRVALEVARSLNGRLVGQEGVEYE
jgi:hypothetical protein